METATIDYAKIAQSMLEGSRTEDRNGRRMYFTSNELATEFILTLATESHSLDYAHEFTYELLNVLADSEATNEDEAHESVSDVTEADVYTSDLTTWLDASNYHIYWLTEALENYDPKDGFSALSMAQQLAKEDVGHLLVGFIAEKQK